MLLDILIIKKDGTIELEEYTCKKCRRSFVPDDKKINGNYYKTCRDCRSKNNKNKDIYHDCKSCHRSFISKDDKKTCYECRTKRNGYKSCKKCSTIITTEDIQYCEKCYNLIEKYKKQLLRESEEARKYVIEQGLYSNKETFIRIQLHYLYYVNDIDIKSIELKLRCDIKRLCWNIITEIDKHKYSWNNIKLVFKKNFNKFKNPDKEDFYCYENISFC